MKMKNYQISKFLARLCLSVAISLSPVTAAIAQAVVTAFGPTILAQTAHDEVQLTDGIISASSTAFNSATATFTQSDVGKTITINGAGAAGADLVTTITAFVDAHHVTLAAAASTTVPWYSVGQAVLASNTATSANYAVGDVLTVSGGSSTTTGQFTIITLGASTPTVNAGGSGGTPGACTITGTTGVTRTNMNTSGVPSTIGYFTATGTVSGGGALTGALTITSPGDYTTPITTTTAEPVTGCGLSGATVALFMAPHSVQQSRAGIYSALPSNPVSLTGGTGAGATLTLFRNWSYNNTFNAIATQVGGYFVYGTDDTAALNTGIKRLMGAAGGILQLPCGTSLVSGALVLPFTGTSPPVQSPIRLTGCGNIGAQTAPGGTGAWGDTYFITGQGSVLDMHYSGSGSAVAKIDTRGTGTVEIDHITFEDTGTDNELFIQTTNSELFVHDNTFAGNRTCFQTTCQQDIIRMGQISSSSPTVGGALSSAVFQGYGTYVNNNIFDHNREAVQFGSAANGINVRNNAVSYNSGSNLNPGAPFHIYGSNGGNNEGNQIDGVIELGGYMYAVAMTSNGSHALQNLFTMSVYDANLGLPTVGVVYAEAGAVANTVAPPYYQSVLESTLVSGPGATGNLIIDTLLTGTHFPQSVTFPKLVVGATSGQNTLNVLGGTGSGEGSRVCFIEGAGSSLIGCFGNFSGINGGSYNQTFTLYGASNGIWINSDGLEVGVATGGMPAAGSINISGVYKVNNAAGLASKSCVAAAATLTITGGLITATSGC